MLWILILGVVLALVLLVSQGRSYNEIEHRLTQLAAQNQQLKERVDTLEALVLEKEKRRPFDELK